MIFFAEINTELICVSVKMVVKMETQFENEFHIPVDELNSDLIYRKYENGHWSQEKFFPLTSEQQRPIEEQIIELKEKQIATDRAVDETSTTQQQLLELLDELGVIS